jgi:hypothetical protein
MSSRLRLGKPVLAVLIALAVLIGIAVYFRWWDRYIEKGLAEWAVSELDRRTDGAYRLELGDLTFRPLSGSLSFDSAAVVTDSAKNLSRTSPLPTLSASAHHCVLLGVNVPRLFLKKSFDAGTLGCDSVLAAITLIPSAVAKREAPPDTLGINTPVHRLVRPLGIPLFRITEISFPQLSFTLRRPGPHGGASAVLDHAEFRVADLVFDPLADPRARRSVSSRSARIVATGLLMRRDTLGEFAIARFETDLIDSTLGLAGAHRGPSVTDDEWLRLQKVRRDRIRMSLDSLAARGIAYRTLVTTGDIEIRAIEARGLSLNVLSDKRLPAAPPKRHQTPQHAAAGVELPFKVDTVTVNGGEIIYLERKPEKERPGRISFDSVHGRVLDLVLPSRGKPLRFEARARLMNEGRLSVRATVPLDARDFRYELEGKLGPMPATAVNGFLEEVEPIRLAKGQVDSVNFRQVVKRGRSVTTLTPRYHDLSIESSGEGGGVIGSVKRGVVKFVANTFKVRDENPTDDGKHVRVANAIVVYDPTKSWITFIWYGLREGLKLTIMK